MIKGTFSRTEGRHIDFGMEQGTVSFPPTGSGWFGLYMLTGGACVLRFAAADGTAFNYQLEPGTVMCLDDSYAVTITEAEPDAAWKAVYFQPTFINRNMKQEVMLSDDYRRMADRHGLFRLEPFLSRRMQDHAFTLSLQEQSLFAQYFKTIEAQLTGEDDWYWSCRVRSYFMDMLSALDEIRKQRAAWEPDADFTLFSTMTALIRERMETPMTVTEMCARFDLNRNQLQTLFHRFAGCAYMEYVHSVRLEHAQYYLRFTELTLPEIAHRVGFGTTHNFSRFFSEQAGESATDFRTRTVAERKEAFKGK